MQRLVDCSLIVNSVINGKSESVSINGKGYCKDDNHEVVIYFSNEDMKYKYICKDENIIINCNDSCYNFTLNKENKGVIKNGDYTFDITTFATRIELYENLIILEYELRQHNVLIGTYKSQLSF